MQLRHTNRISVEVRNIKGVIMKPNLQTDDTPAATNNRDEHGTVLKGSVQFPEKWQTNRWDSREISQMAVRATSFKDWIRLDSAVRSEKNVLQVEGIVLARLSIGKWRDRESGMTLDRERI